MNRVFFRRNKVNKNSIDNQLSKKSFLRLFTQGILASILLLFVSYAVFAFMPFVPGLSHKTISQGNNPTTSVLGDTTNAVSEVGNVAFNIPAIFNDSAEFKKDLTVDGKTIFNDNVKLNNKNLDLGTGIITAANLNNLINGLTAGSGITVTQGSTPTISNAGVLSVEGQVGAVTFTQGSGITISGTTITNSGVTSFGGQTGSITLTAGNGIAVSGTTISDTIANGLTANGIVYANGSSVLASINPPASSGYLLESTSGGAPIWSTSVNLGGILTDGTYAGANAILYAAPSSGQFSTATTSTGSQCLLSSSGVSGIPSWGTCALGTNLWQLNSGVLSATNITNDLAIGGSSTSSALFQVFANTGNATTAGALTFTGLGSQLQTVKNQILKIGGNTTGDIQFLPGNSPSSLYLSSNGNVAIGTTSASHMLEVYGQMEAGIQGNIGSIFYSLGLTRGGNGTLTTPQLYNNTGTSNALILAGGVSGGGTVAVSNALSVGTISPLATFDVRANSGGQSVASISGNTMATSLVIDNTGTGDLIAASTAGLIRFAVTNNGNININNTALLTTTGGSSAPILYNRNITGTGYAQFYTGGISAENGIYMAGNGDTITSAYNLSNSYVELAGGNNSGNSNPTGAILKITGPSYANNPSDLLMTGFVGINNTGTTLGNSALTVNQSNVTGDIFSASSSGNSEFTIGNNGSITDANYMTSGGLFYATNTGLLQQTGAGTTGQCLLGGTTPAWGSCALGTQYWQLNNSVLSPVNANYDLAVGGNSTNSALFQVFAANGNATSSGNFTFANAGIIQSTANQNLTVGGNSTGNIILSPLNSSGYVGIGTSNPSQMLSLGYGNVNLSEVAPPTSAPTIALGSAGVLNTTGYYNYVVTYVNSIGESIAGPLSNSVTPTNQQINLTNIPIGPAGTTARKIYRNKSAAAGSLFYYVTTISDNVTTTYTDNTPDSSLGTAQPVLSTTGSLTYLNGTLIQVANEDTTILGFGAGSSETGLYNTLMGYYTGHYNTVGISNTAVGNQALQNNTSGNYNTALGFRAMINNTTGGANTAIGENAMLDSRTGSNNTVIGYYAGLGVSNNSYSNNTLLGYYSGNALSTGSNNVLLGYNSGNNLTSGANNIILGYNLAASSATVNNSLNIGGIIYGDTSIQSVGVNTSSFGNGAFVVNQPNSSGSIFAASSSGSTKFVINNNGNVGIGGISTANQALEIAYGNLRFDQVNAPGAPTVVAGSAGNLTGNYQYAITYVTANGETNMGAASAVVSPSSQQVNLTNIPTAASGLGVTARNIYRTTAGGTTYLLLTTISDNVTTTYTDNTVDGSLGSDYTYRDNTTGAQLYLGSTGAGFLGTYSTGFGQAVLANNTLGYQNTAFGVKALTNNTTGNQNTAIGYLALKNNSTGSANTALGLDALLNNTYGGSNVGIGQTALFDNTTGSFNVGIGNNALFNNTTGTRNTATGYDALYTNTTGQYNSAYGHYALESSTTSSYNTAVGEWALQADTTGGSNTALGYYAGAGLNTINALTTGISDTFIGYSSGFASPVQFNFSTAIGAGSLVQASNNLILGGTGTYAVNVGIGTTSALATIDVRGNIGTQPVASFSGTTSNATLVANNDGVGPLFSASSSGWPRFNVRNDGSIDLGIGGVNNVPSSGGSGTGLYINGNYRLGDHFGTNNYTILTPLNGLLSLNNPTNNAALQISNSAGTNWLKLTQQGNNSQLFNADGNGFLLLQPTGSSNGVVAIGSTAPLYQTALYVKETTANETLLIDQEGTGGIITASQGGNLKFQIANNGAITDKNYITSGGVLYADGTGLFTQTGSGNAGQCLLGGTTPAWGSCALGTQYWQLNNNVLSPSNSNYDLGIGGTGTGSALFQVFANTINTQPAGTASTSGNLSFTGSSNAINMLNGGSLNFETSTGGDSGLTSRLFIANNGNVGIGTVTPSRLLEVSGSGNQYSRITSTTTNEAGIELVRSGNGVNSWAFVIGGSGGNVGRFDLRNSTNQFASSYTTYARFQPLVGMSLGAGATDPLATFDVRSLVGTNPTASISGATSFAALVVDNSGVGDIVTASSSGATRFVITQAGNVGIGTATPVSTLQLNSGGGANADTLTIGNISSKGISLRDTGTAVDILSSGVPLYVNNATAVNTYINPTKGGYVGIGNALPGNTQLVVNQPNTNGDIFDASQSGNAKFVINNNGNVGIGITNPNTPLHVMNTNSGVTSNVLTLGNGSVNNNTGAQINFNLSTTNTTFTADIAAVRTNAGGGGNAATYLSFGTNPGTNSSGTNEVLRLSEFGGAGFQTNSIGNDALVVNQPNSSGDIFSASQGGNTKFVISNAGNVGIGTTNPSATLDIGSHNLNGTTTPAFLVLSDVTSNANGNALINGQWNSPNSWGIGPATNSLTDNTLRIGNISGNFGRTWNATQNLSILLGGTLGNSALKASALDIEQNSLGNSALVVNNSGGAGDIFTASSAGSPKFVINSSGNVGIGTTAPVDKLNVLGNITIGAQVDASSGAYTSLNSAAGTFGSQTNIEGATSSAVFKGKLFVATRSTASGGSAGVYRYDGGTTWTLVTHAPGQAVTADAANSISGYSMVVYDGKLFIGSQTSTAEGSGTASVYVSSTADTTADSFSLNSSSTQGTIVTGGTANIDSIDSMVVYNNELYILTGKIGAAEIYKYQGGTGTAAWVVVTTVPGEPANNVNDAVAGGILLVFDGNLYLGSRTGVAQNAAVFVYNGKNQSANPFTVINSTRGKFDQDTNYQDVTAMTVYNGEMYVAVTKGPGTAEVYRYYQGTFVSAGIGSPFKELNGTAGKIDPNVDTTQSVRAITSMVAYNGQLFVGSETNNGGTGAIYQYDPTTANNFSVTLLGSNKGVYGSDTGISAVYTMIEMNGTLYIGTDQANKGSIYTWTGTKNNSFALKFDSGSTNPNYGAISFVGSTDTESNLNHTGTFLFSNAIALASGGFDYAEDYQTNDHSLMPGDVVQIDPNNSGYVEVASNAAAVIGVYSSNPGFELKPSQSQSSDANYIPVALSGRVPVRVTTENGSIQIGDFLTTSSIPGVAMKATKEGYVIGKALESYTNTDQTAIGKIMVFTNISFADPSLSIMADGNISSVATDMTASVEAESNSNVSGINTLNYSTQFSNLSSTVTDLRTSVASITAQLTKVQSIDDLTLQMTNLEKQVSILTGISAIGSQSASILGTTTTDATISGNLSVAGKTLLTNLGVTGTISAGVLTVKGLDETGNASINTLSGPLKLQSDGINSVDIANGKVVIDPIGDLKTVSGITAKKYNVDTSDTNAASVGEGIIPAGKTEVIIKTSAVSGNSRIFVTPHTPALLGVISQVKGQSFTVMLDKAQTTDIHFDWWIIN